MSSALLTCCCSGKGQGLEDGDFDTEFSENMSVAKNWRVQNSFSVDDIRAPGDGQSAG